jgi:RNA polymerase sigma-70 factor (ECF subfamily)
VAGLEPRSVEDDAGREVAVLDVEALYRKYGPMVLRRCRSLLHDEEKALDAMQDTFVRVLRSADRLTGDAPSSLLYRVATNVCLNALRAQRVRREAPDEEALLSATSRDDVEALGQARHIIDRIFEREDPSTRTMAMLHYVDGLTLEETAARSGLSVSGVRKRLAGLKARSQRSEGEEG